MIQEALASKADFLLPLNGGKKKTIEYALRLAKAKQSIDFPYLPPTLEPYWKLLLFNTIYQDLQLHQRISPDINRRLAPTYDHYCSLEAIASKSSDPFPTIGFELEIPDSSRLDRFGLVIDQLDISHEWEQGMDGPLYEVNPGFSYHRQPVKAMLQEMIRLGGIPLESPASSRSLSFPHLSLHLNFGIPDSVSLDSLQRNFTNTQIVVDLLTYGHDTTKRLEERKTHTAIKIKDRATPTLKSKSRADETLYVDTNNIFEFSLKDSRKHMRRPYRFELRSLELHHYHSTCLAIDESHDLMTLIFLALGGERKLQKVWSEMVTHGQNLINFYFNGVISAYDYPANVFSVTEVLRRSPSLARECRRLTHHYSGVVQDYLC